LQFAQEKLGTSGRYLYVAADAYQLPFRPGSFDAATIVRVIHHIADVSAALKQIRQALVPGGTLILEYANKRNIKAMLRYMRGLQRWNPTDLEPVEFVELNFDFHPKYMEQKLTEAGFMTMQSIPVSFFRMPMLKNIVPTHILASLDGLLQLSRLHYTPSIFTKNVAVGATPYNLGTDSLFICPETGDELMQDGDILIGKQHGRRWAIRDGIYDFKAPLDE
jgi:SAM-dependent methyltransferase